MSDQDTIRVLSGEMTAANDQLDSREAYYEGTMRLASLGLSLPPEMRRLATVINWPRLVVDSLEERLDVEGFRLAGQTGTDERLWSWWQANNLDEESGPGHLEALVQGRAYIVVGPGDGEDDPPVITVESPGCMYAKTDPRTRAVVSALRLYDVRDDGQPHAATLYEPDRTAFFVYDAGGWVADGEIAHNLGVVPVVPMVNRARLRDRVGRSEMADVAPITDAACRTLTNLQGAQELLAVPQRYVLGATEQDFVGADGNPKTAWEAYLGRFLALANENAKMGELSGADLGNFTRVLDTYARMVSALSGLPPHFLGYSSESNPASADAIRSSEARLVKRAERKQRAFGGAWEQALRIALRVAGAGDDATRLETVWRDAATPTYAAKADAVTKLYAAGVIPLDAAWEQLGYSPEYRRRLRDMSADDPAARFLASLDQLGAPAA